MPCVPHLVTEGAVAGFVVAVDGLT
jgi:hypothetical protein